jgi:two-component system OmpR family sensor kinase
VTNLVTNALIHTPVGTPVYLTVRPHVPSTDGEPPVAQAGMPQQPHTAPGVLEVHDEGLGIPAERAVRVFDRFHGGDPTRPTRAGTTGDEFPTVVAITAAILEAHNGRIELHTAPRRGTTFRVLLPLA